MADNRRVFKWLMIPIVMLSFGLFVGGCSGGDDDDDSATEAPATPTPLRFYGEVSFDNPDDGDTITLNLALSDSGDSWDKTFPIQFSVDDFAVQEQDKCGNEYACGRVQLLIDDELNAETVRANANSLVADFSKVSSPLGDHTLSLKLVFDDGSDADASASIGVKVEAPSPTVAVTSPTVANEEISTANNTVTATIIPAQYIVSSSCGSELNCGQFYLYFTDVNDEVEDGYTLTDVGTTDAESPGQYFVDFDVNELDTPEGSHHLHVNLVDDSGSAYTNVAGQPVEGTATFNVKGANDPTIVIDSPTNGATVELGTDGYKTVTMTYTIENFTVPTDGYVRVSMTGGNYQEAVPATEETPAIMYHTISLSPTTAELQFYWKDYLENSSVGAQTVTVQLFDNDDNAVKSGAANVTANVLFTTAIAEDSTNPTLTIVSPTGATTRLTEKKLDIRYATDTDLFQLTDPTNGCTGATLPCGSVKAYIDDDAHAGAAAATGDNTGVLTLDFSGMSDDDLYSEAGHRIMLLLVDDSDNPVTIPAGSDNVEVADWATYIILKPLPGGN